MSNISIIGTGNMASTIGALAVAGGNTVEVIGRDQSKAADLAKALGGSTTTGEFGAAPADRLVTPVDMQSTYPGKEQPYPPQMTRNLDPVLLWTVAATATSRVRLNASTLSTFYYEPTHLARLLTTLDVLF